MKNETYWILESDETIRDKDGEIYDVVTSIHKKSYSYESLLLYCMKNKLDGDKFYIEKVTVDGFLKDEEYVGHLNVLI